MTLKAAQAFEEDITDLLPTEITNRKGLTEARVKELSRSEKASTRRYSNLRKDHHWGGKGSRNEDRREDWDQNSHSDRSGG